jgi:site-specific recombinase XerD
MDTVTHANRAIVWPQRSNRVKVPEAVPEELADLLGSWLLRLRTENRSIQTQRLYLGTVADLSRFLAARGMPTDVASMTGEHLREYFLEQLERGLSAKTVHSRHGFLSVFFRWLVEEGELRENPMARIKPPKVDETLPPVVTDEQFAAMLRTCTGRGPNDRRDEAILRLLEATGMRRAECAAARLNDVDLDEMTVTLMGKGRRVRRVPFTPETALAIDRYLRERKRKRYAPAAELFLARTGPMSPNAVGEVVYLRAKKAGLVDAKGSELVSAHMFRHRFADRWKRDGGTEDALMALGGWRNRDIMARYGRANAASRAIDEYRRLRR